MGRVLLAHDPVLDREVALKHLRGDLRIPRDVREGLLVRMRHEARAAARVAHPNLVTLHDMGEDPALGLYLVFEYVEGPTLKDRLLAGPLSPAQAARLAREIGEALTLAHGAGVVHRDIKPENIILSSKGAKVADFGIARIPDSTLTHQGGLMGTPAYSAPETFRAGKFSPESDQFSLAAVVYEALSGKRAFPGDDAVSVASRIAHDTPPPLAASLRLPPAVDEVLGRALSKRPEERFATCEEFGGAFARSVEDGMAPRASEPRAARGPAPVPSEIPPRERRTGQVILGAAVVVVTAALLLRTALRSAEGQDPGPEDAPAASVAPAAAASSSPRSRPPSHAGASTPPARPTRPKAEPVESAAPSASAGPSPDASAGPSPDAGAAGTTRDAGAVTTARDAGAVDAARATD
ncbi:MAG: protein kinase [Polyangiaceae bacterium]|nr:protein kinase [Polyangiaceae bacterium]